MGDPVTLQQGAQPPVYCVIDFLQDNEGSGDMIRCCLCQKWFHGVCLGLSEDDEVGVWCCFKCRNIRQDTITMKKDINKLVATIENIERSTSLILERQQSILEKLEQKEAECYVLSNENNRLSNRIKELEQEMSLKTHLSKN